MSECDETEELPDNAENIVTVKREPTDDSKSDEEKKLNLLQQVRREKESGNIKIGTHAGYKVMIDSFP